MAPFTVGPGEPDTAEANTFYLRNENVISNDVVFAIESILVSAAEADEVITFAQRRNASESDCVLPHEMRSHNIRSRTAGGERRKRVPQ